MPRITYPSLQAPPYPALNETVTESRWHLPFSDPAGTMRKNVNGTALVAIAASGLVFNPLPINDITRSSPPWFLALSEPVRTKPGLLAGLQSFLALTQAAPFVETSYESKWHYAWSEPVKIPARLVTGAQLTVPIAPVADQLRESSWHYAWSEPVRIKRGLYAPYHQAFLPGLIALGNPFNRAYVIC